MGTRRDCIRSRWVLALTVLPMLNGPTADLRKEREGGGKEGGTEGKEGGRKREGEI